MSTEELYSKVKCRKIHVLCQIFGSLLLNDILVISQHLPTHLWSWKIHILSLICRCGLSPSCLQDVDLDPVRDPDSAGWILCEVRVMNRGGTGDQWMCVCVWVSVSVCLSSKSVWTFKKLICWESLLVIHPRRSRHDNTTPLGPNQILCLIWHNFVTQWSLSGFWSLIHSPVYLLVPYSVCVLLLTSGLLSWFWRPLVLVKASPPPPSTSNKRWYQFWRAAACFLLAVSPSNFNTLVRKWWAPSGIIGSARKKGTVSFWGKPRFVESVDFCRFRK